MKEYEKFLEKLELDKSPHTIRSYKSAIDEFLVHFNINNIEDIKKLTPGHYDDYMVYLKSKGLKASSVNTFIRPIKVFLNWLKTREHINRNPFKGLEYLSREQRIPFFITDGEASAMMNSCKNLQDKLIISFLLYEGLRREELCDLKISDLIIESSEIHISVKGKGDKERQAPLLVHPVIDDDLRKFLSNRRFSDNEYLFVSPFNKRFSSSSIWYKVKSVGKRAGIEESRLDRLTPHKLRHTACTELSTKANDDTVQAFMGHSNIETTKIYTHLKNNAMDDAIRKMKYDK
jgi:site-specific recombinase XerD